MGKPCEGLLEGGVSEMGIGVIEMGIGVIEMGIGVYLRVYCVLLPIKNKGIFISKS
jgi:hypothetical protein